MQSIGERLEEARKRKGISLREAAEATKIRSDFLSNIEQNKFEFELPEIYKRGFIKNYARYLKLDPEKIITDFSAQQLGNARGKKSGTEWFGTMEIKPSDKDGKGAGDIDESPSYGSIKAKRSDSLEDSEDDDSDDGDKMFYLKAAVVFLGIVALVFVIFGLVRAILGSPNETPAQAELRDPATTIEQPVAPPSTPATVSGTGEFKLVASGTVFVAARQLNDRKMLYQGTLGAGEEVVLQKEGPVEIVFTAAENISVEFDGGTIRPEGGSASGSSKIKLP